MKPYIEYKETGLDWLPRVPKHWEVKRAKFIFKTINERSTTGEEELLSVSHITGVTKRKANVTMFKAESYVGYKVCRPNDLVINSMWAWMGALGVAPLHGIVSTAYSVYRMDEQQLFPPFANLLLRIKWYAQDFENRSKGIWTSRLILSDDAFGNTLVIVPPLDEQKRIVSYLAAKNREIESYIAAKRALLVRLKELSAAVISRAVTRGLNPDVETKPSGVEWLGDVPKHWEVKRLKHVCRVHTGSRNTEDKVDDGLYPFFVRSQTVERINSFSFEGEAVLTAGDGAGVGKVFHHYNGCFEVHQRVYVLNNFKGVIGSFLFHHLREHFHRIALIGTAKSTVDSLRMPVFLNFIVPLPPLDEQRAIVAFIESQLATIREAQSRIEREIELARELWTTLVAEVVTGQVDVSDWSGTNDESDWDTSTQMLEDEAELVEEEDVVELQD